jgi:hypothetical protein
MALFVSLDPAIPAHMARRRSFTDPHGLDAGSEHSWFTLRLTDDPYATTRWSGRSPWARQLILSI